MLLGQTLWIVLIAFACSFLGALQVPVFVASLMYALVGGVYDLRVRSTEAAATDDDADAGGNTTSPSVSTSRSTGLMDRVISLLDVPASTADDETVVTSSTSDDAKEEDRLRLRLHVTHSTDAAPATAVNRSQSEFYFRALFLACAATVFYQHVWLLFVAAVPIAVYAGHVATVSFAVRDVLHAQCADLTERLHGWVIVRHSAVLPVCLPGVLRLNRKVHRAVRRTLRDSIDTASSILMIVLLLLTVIFAGVFCAVEIYSEAITVVQLGNDVVNWTLCHRPELMNMFPEGVTSSMDDVIENAYQYGRTGIGTYVDELLKDADAEQRTQLREQLLSVWDRLIQYWLDRKKEGNGGGGPGVGEAFSGPQVPASAITDQIGEIVNNEGGRKCLTRVIFFFAFGLTHIATLSSTLLLACGHRRTELSSLSLKRAELFTVAQQGLIGWVKKNLDILMEVLNSVRGIVQANLSVLTSICWTLCSLFLGGGQAVITFIINSVRLRIYCIYKQKL